jgi:hypothetical protein
MAMKKLLLTGVAALFLATGTARADDFVVLIQKDNETTSTAFVRMNMSCEEMLESHERNRKAGYLVGVYPRQRRALANNLGRLSQCRFKNSLPPDHGRENAQG